MKRNKKLPTRGVARDGKNKRERAVPLTCFQAGGQGVIAAVRPDRQTDLYKLRAMGLLPGAPVLVERTFPVLAIRLPYARLFMDEELASGILVYPTERQKDLQPDC